MPFSGLVVPHRAATLETRWVGDDRSGTPTEVPVQVFINLAATRAPQGVIRLNYDPTNAVPVNWTAQQNIPFPWLAGDLPIRTADGGTTRQNALFNRLQTSLSELLPLLTGVE